MTTGTAVKIIDAIRPDDLMTEAKRLREESGQLFWKRHHSQFIERPCPACASEGTFAFKKYGFPHCLCTHCKTLYVTPRPDDSLLDRYYNTYPAPHYWTQVLLQTDSTRKALQYRPRAQKIISLIKQHLRQTPDLAVDIGAGSGAFALALKHEAYFASVLAMDISREAVEKCRKAGLDARIGSADMLEESSVDYIALNDIIEHLPEPVLFLETCRRALKPGGLLSIACPNGEGFDFQIMKEHTVNIAPPEHLQYFNPYAITVLLNGAGFETAAVETPGILDVEIVERSAANGECSLADNTYIQYLLTQCNEKVKQNFQRFLAENKLSSHMLVLAKKHLQ